MDDPCKCDVSVGVVCEFCLTGEALTQAKRYIEGNCFEVGRGGCDMKAKEVITSTKAIECLRRLRDGSGGIFCPHIVGSSYASYRFF